MSNLERVKDQFMRAAPAAEALNRALTEATRALADPTATAAELGVALAMVNNARAALQTAVLAIEGVHS